MTRTSNRTTHSSVKNDRLALLNAGLEQSRTLAECLAVDFAAIARECVRGASQRTITTLADAQRLGILRRMELAGSLLLADLGAGAIKTLAKHRSDTVRSWSCFMIGAQDDLKLAGRLDAIKPLSDDEHFGVREWAWMAVRPHLVIELPAAIGRLSEWTSHRSPRVRRFACEAIRPRGVWCTHIGALRNDPQMALPVLEPLRADPEKYVQNSVANWLNDASKDQPEWVRKLCARWLRESPDPSTERICARAQRTLKAPQKTSKRRI